MSEVLKIILLALIQGICEFFPVSSSGHLVIFQTLLAFTSVPLIFDIFFHLGTLLAVLIFFFKDIKDLVVHFSRPENHRLILMIIVASLPTALIGWIFKDPLEKLFVQPAAVGIGLLISALFLFASLRLRAAPRSPYLAALIIGVFQGLAIVPGISRSGVTIAVGLMLSLGYGFSFKFSFLLSVPAVIGAALLEISRVTIPSGSLPGLLLGLVLAAIFGTAALAVLKKIVRREKFHLFGFYCLLAGALVILLFR